MTTIITLADQMAKAFTTKQRDNGQTFDVIREDRKEDWMQDVTYAGHLDTMPNDWHYSAIRQSVEYIADNVTDPDYYADDHAHSFADMVTPVYTHELIRWLAECPNAIDYCDDYLENMGGTVSDGGITSLMQAGCYEMHYQVFVAVWEALESVAGEMECEE